MSRRALGLGEHGEVEATPNVGTHRASGSVQATRVVPNDGALARTTEATMAWSAKYHA